MAHPHVDIVVAEADLGAMSLKRIPGLTPVDLKELEGLKIGSVKALCTALYENAGALDRISVEPYIIEPLQAVHIGDCVLVFLRSNFLDHSITLMFANWELGNTVSIPAHVPAATSHTEERENTPLWSPDRTLFRIVTGK